MHAFTRWSDDIVFFFLHDTHTHWLRTHTQFTCYETNARGHTQARIRHTLQSFGSSKLMRKLSFTLFPKQILQRVNRIFADNLNFISKYDGAIFIPGTAITITTSAANIMMSQQRVDFWTYIHHLLHGNYLSFHSAHKTITRRWSPADFQYFRIQCDCQKLKQNSMFNHIPFWHTFISSSSFVFLCICVCVTIFRCCLLFFCCRRRRRQMFCV